MTLTGANTSELFQLEKQLAAMIDRLDGVTTRGSSFLGRLIDTWLGPLATLFGDTWQHADLPSINGARDSLQQLKDQLTVNRIEQERASGGRDSTPIPDRRAANRTQPAARSAGTPYNELEQQTSHNTYEHQTITESYESGDRAFELDIHIGDPLPRSPFISPLLSLIPDNGLPNDFYVYHNSADSHTEIEKLSVGLDQIAALPRDEPTTLFIDVKDELGGNHDPQVLDNLIHRKLGDRVYTPQDLIEWAQEEHPDAGITTVGEATAIAGWPTDEELQGRTIVVLTDNVDNYPQNENSQAFVAAKPSEIDENTAFVNVPEGETSEAQIKEWQEQGLAVRTYPEGAIHGVSAGDPAPDLDGATFDAEDYNKPKPAKDAAKDLAIDALLPKPPIGLGLLD